MKSKTLFLILLDSEMFFNQSAVVNIFGVLVRALHLIYTEQKKKRNNRSLRIFEFKGKTLIISGLLLYDSHSCDIRVYHAKN